MREVPKGRYKQVEYMTRAQYVEHVIHVNSSMTPETLESKLPGNTLLISGMLGVPCIVSRRNISHMLNTFDM